MKIAFVVPAYWPSVIGVSFYCQDLAEGLVKRGHEVTIYAGQPGGWPTEEERKGVLIKRFDRKYIGSFYRMPSLVKGLKDADFDIVHSHHYGYYEATAGLKAAKHAGKPHLFGPYYHPPIYGIKKWLLWKLYHWRFGRALLEKSDIVLPHTEFEKQLLLKVGGKEDAMRILPNTVDTKMFKPSGKRGKTVLFVSNLLTEKGAGVAMHLAEEITQERNDIKFVFKGRPNDERLKETIERLKNNPHIQFITEDISKKDLSKLYSKASVVVLPSKYEAFSKVLAEAQACEAAVVATKVGGISEVVQDGKSGYLVNYGDWAALKEKVLFLLNNPKHARKMGASGRKHIVQNFDTEKIIDRLEEIYEELV